MAILFTLRDFAKNLLKSAEKKYFSYFVLMCDLGQEHGFSSNRPTCYLLDHGDFYIKWKVYSNLLKIDFIFPKWTS